MSTTFYVRIILFLINLQLLIKELLTIELISITKEIKNYIETNYFD